MLSTNLNQTVRAALAFSTKSHFRAEPVTRPVAHVVSGFLILAASTGVAIFASQRFAQSERDSDALLMPLFATPCPLFDPTAYASDTADKGADSTDSQHGNEVTVAR